MEPNKATIFINSKINFKFADISNLGFDLFKLKIIVDFFYFIFFIFIIIMIH